MVARTATSRGSLCASVRVSSLAKYTMDVVLRYRGRLSATLYCLSRRRPSNRSARCLRRRSLRASSPTSMATTVTIATTMSPIFMFSFTMHMSLLLLPTATVVVAYHDPSEHLVHTGAASALNLPSSQAVHAVSPALSWNRPASQAVQGSHPTAE